MKVEIRKDNFDPWQEVAQFEQQLPVGKFGATAAFVGTMRDFNEGDSVSELELEHYPGMTEYQLESVSHAVMQELEINDVLVVHRVGIIYPGDAIVLVVVCSPHRAQAFEACERIVEYLKSKAPFWKKESLSEGRTRWVEHNTQGRASTN